MERLDENGNPVTLFREKRQHNRTNLLEQQRGTKEHYLGVQSRNEEEQKRKSIELEMEMKAAERRSIKKIDRNAGGICITTPKSSASSSSPASSSPMRGSPKTFGRESPMSMSNQKDTTASEGNIAVSEEENGEKEDGGIPVIDDNSDGLDLYRAYKNKRATLVHAQAAKQDLKFKRFTGGTRPTTPSGASVATGKAKTMPPTSGTTK